MRSLFITPLVACCLLAGAAEIPISIPSDANASFFVLEKSGKGLERTIVTKRIGSSGTSFSKRFYNCKDDTVKYIGTGDTIEAMNTSRPDLRMSSIVQGSIAYHVGIFACK
jgi:hypothetical protein